MQGAADAMQGAAALPCLDKTRPQRSMQGAGAQMTIDFYEKLNDTKHGHNGRCKGRRLCRVLTRDQRIEESTKKMDHDS